MTPHRRGSIVRALRTCLLRGGATSDFTKFSGTNEIVGESHPQNISRGIKYAQNDAAAPNLGQAYLIINTKWPKGVKSPYHAAGVVSVDGNDRVTLEVFANSKQSTSRTESGSYSMYSVNGSGDVFHSYWQDSFFKKNSVTTVIEPI